MTSQNEQTSAQVKRPRDPDMIGAEAAMHRAAKIARRRGFRDHRRCRGVQRWENGVGKTRRHLH